MSKRFHTSRLATVVGLSLLGIACASGPSQESTGQYVDDSVITGRVLAKLAADPETSAMAITVETYKGVVQLSGFVDSGDEASKAAELARHTPGVRTVENRLSVKETVDQVSHE